MSNTASYTITIKEHDCELDVPNDEALAASGVSFDAYFETYLKGRSKYCVSLLDVAHEQRVMFVSSSFHRDNAAEQRNSLTQGLDTACAALSVQYQRNY